MEIAHFLIELVLHVDVALKTFVTANGDWIYALLFAIVFVETGLVVLPFLPGDSLLFIAGTFCGLGLMSLPLAMALLVIAAVLGDQLNYSIGRYFGPKVFQWEQSRFFNKKAFDAAHAFYEKNGGITIILARFMPFVRTFAPFVAGVSEMSRRSFTLFNLIGGALWVVGLMLAGYLFGNIPMVQHNLEKIIWALVILPTLVVVVGGWRAKQKAKASAA